MYETAWDCSALSNLYRLGRKREGAAKKKGGRVVSCTCPFSFRSGVCSYPSLTNTIANMYTPQYRGTCVLVPHTVTCNAGIWRTTISTTGSTLGPLSISATTLFLSPLPVGPMWHTGTAFSLLAPSSPSGETEHSCATSCWEVRIQWRCSLSNLWP